jgi:hypothetical protein
MVEVYDPIEKKTYEYYMNPRLKNILDIKVKPALQKKDKDYVIVLDGKEGSGKSTLGVQIGKYVDPTLSLDRVCINATEFRKAIVNAKKGQCVIFDEAYRGLGSTGALSEVNKLLKSMMMEMRQKNLLVIVILPTFYLLERYVALWRARVLLHVFERKGIRGYFKAYNSHKKQMLYNDPYCKRNFVYSKVKTRFKGRFYGKWVVESEEEYRNKKAEAFKKEFKHAKVKSEKYFEQRNQLLYGIYKDYGLSLSELVNFCKLNKVRLKKTQISTIIAKFKG